MRTRPHVIIFLTAYFFVVPTLFGQSLPCTCEEPTLSVMDQLIHRIFASEQQENKEITSLSPKVETYILKLRVDPLLGAVPKSDLEFLGRADFRRRIKLHSMIRNRRQGWFFFWSFHPEGFLQMAFIDLEEFDHAHYVLKYVTYELLNGTCFYLFDVNPAPKVRGTRFKGRIWVEDRDFFIVHFCGSYVPSAHISWKTLEDTRYVRFDSWRSNVKTGLWLPSYITSQNPGQSGPFGVPNYVSLTQFSDFQLEPTTPSVAESLNRNQ